ncbi:hypothetical protein KO525_11940 [Psychrosphaera sp. B3R10]|uniref:hypothetical protein n=1 Tax=unclassified Psychrosphaera TaxID=2641570 RepID=UPI001C0829ED|nr:MULTISPECIES: hypothetical protein [unclassified Psychrosphaera]MBU2881724.1 hypothetical protein [Psychrosphaera sp. I2R16]MBU2990091.1 hypothetical protein [Psychrosphaera sp. B3R10]
MISGINSSGEMSRPSRMEQSLTADQKTQISDVLGQFDPENLTESDAKSIVEAFSEAGITPGSGLASAMGELGYDAKTVGDLANVEQQGNRPPPPPPPSGSAQSSDELSSLVEYFTELMEEKLAESGETELSDNDKQSILAQLYDKFGIDEGKSIINTVA